MPSKSDKPRSLTLPTTPKWKLDLLHALKPRGAKKELAQSLGVHQSLISKLLGPAMQSSKYVIEISQWAGIPLPIIAAEEALWTEVGRTLLAVAPEKYRELLRVATKIASRYESTEHDIKGLDD